MIVTHNEKEISELCRSWREAGLTVGFVPTMGALHPGHTSLVDKALESCDRVVVSIFLNPTQFGEGEDLNSYPKTIEKDCSAVKTHGAHAVFTPEASVVYPDGFSTGVVVKGVTQGLCGARRPGHFDGVTTVCSVLFGIVKPDVAVFGMKDAQQLAVIRRMVTDLRLGIRIIGAPIVREPDGLALSSRNRYLSVVEREEAALIVKGLEAARDLASAGEKHCFRLTEAFTDYLLDNSSVLSVQYAETVDPDTMLAVENVGKTVLLAVAVFAGKTRLIDNIIIESEV